MQQHAVHDRNVGRHDHGARRHHPAIADDAAQVALAAGEPAFVDGDDLRVLEDLPAQRDERALEALQVDARMDRRLIVEPQRAGDRKRQRRPVDQRRVQAQLANGLGLAFQRGVLRLRLREREPGDAPKVAVDGALVGELGDAIDRGALAARHQPRPRDAETRDQGLVGDIQRFGQVGRGFPCLPFADTACLDHGDLAARSGQQQRRRDPGDAAADDRDVDGDVLRQRRIWRRRRGLGPDGVRVVRHQTSTSLSTS